MYQLRVSRKFKGEFPNEETLGKGHYGESSQSSKEERRQSRETSAGILCFGTIHGGLGHTRVDGRSEIRRASPFGVVS